VGLDLADDAGEIGAGKEEAVESCVGVGGGSPGGWWWGGGSGSPDGWYGRGGGRLRLAEQGIRRRARLVGGDDAERAPPRRRLGSDALLHSWGAQEGDEGGIGRGEGRNGREGSGDGEFERALVTMIFFFCAQESRRAQEEKSRVLLLRFVPWKCRMPNPTLYVMLTVHVNNNSAQVSSLVYCSISCFCGFVMAIPPFFNLFYIFAQNSCNGYNFYSLNIPLILI
jgi:hypothetical protein